MALEQTIGFLGAGKMATALAKGFVQAGLVGPDRLVASDPLPTAAQQFADQTGGRILRDNLAVTDTATILFLAVKPNLVQAVLEEIKPRWKAEHLLFSVAAGIPLARLEQSLGSQARVIRVMPNTPALVGASATAYAVGPAARPEDTALAQNLFSSVGLAWAVKEPLLDAVTGLSGSGPAYVFLIIEALSDGGVTAGLPREIATQLAVQTVLGSAKLVLESGLHPGTLKDMVTSPGGTTVEGLLALEQAGVRAALIQAVRAASDKARRLAGS